MDEIRKSTPADTNKQVDLCVAIANRVFELLQERNMKQRDFAKALGKTETEVSRLLSGTHELQSQRWQRFLVMISLPQHRAIVHTNFQIRKM